MDIVFIGQARGHKLNNRCSVMVDLGNYNKQPPKANDFERRARALSKNPQKTEKQPPGQSALKRKSSLDKHLSTSTNLSDIKCSGCRAGFEGDAFLRRGLPHQ